MRIIFFIIILISSVHGFTQTTSDSLYKYAYNTFGIIQPMGMIFGSGFFVKYDNTPFFVTAKHVFTGCGSLKTPIRPFPKSIYIVLKNPPDVICVDTDSILLNEPCDTIPPFNDFIIIQVNRKYATRINSVESFIYPSFTNVSDTKIIGYPGWIYERNSNAFNPFIDAIEMQLPKKHYFFSVRTDSATGILDSMVGVINCNPFLNDYDSLGGFSGCPIFIQDSISLKWRIAGIFTANTFSNTGMLGLEFIRSELLFDSKGIKKRFYKAIK